MDQASNNSEVPEVETTCESESLAEGVSCDVEHSKGISRIDSKTTKGWLVRGYKNGIRYSKLFSDGKLGGRDQALEKASVFRNELYSRLNAIPANAIRLVFLVFRNYLKPEKTTRRLCFIQSHGALRQAAKSVRRFRYPNMVRS